MSLLREIFNLLVPAKCISCRRSGWSLCNVCRSKLAFAPRICHRDQFAGLCLFDYLEPISDYLTSFKERGVSELAYLLVQQIDGGLVQTWLERIIGPPGESGVISLVPIPSSAEAFRARGFNPAAEVASAFAALLHQAGYSARVVRLLNRSRSVSDQAKLGSFDRWHNQVQSMAARHRFAGRVLLIDDIVTTGATMIEARRACTEAGASVIGFAAIAETLMKRQGNSAKANT